MALLRAERPLGSAAEILLFSGAQLNPNKLTVRRLHQSFAECQEQKLDHVSRCIR